MAFDSVSTRGMPGVNLLPLPPLAPGLPLLGNLPLILKNGLDHMVKLRVQHGDIFTLNLGLTKIIALNHPRHVHHILRENVRNYSKGGIWEYVRELVGNGLPVSEGDFWLKQRRMIQPHFHMNRIAALADLMAQAIEEELGSWDAAAAAGEPFDVARALTRITMKVIVKTMFGTGLDRDEADALDVEMRYMIEYMIRTVVTRGLPRWMPVPGVRRSHQAIQNVDRIVFGIIERRRKAGTEANDLLGMLLGMADADTGERMTERQVRDEAVAMFFAGYETTATTMAWILEVLLRKPELARELEVELDTALGGAAPGFAALRKMPLLFRVLHEGLRLYSPSFWLPRTAVDEDEIDGFRIPAGALVAPIVYAIHRHPDFWEEPERFDPSRFTPERAAKRNPLAWMPFGAGQRVCIGKEFALMEGQLILARILQRYQLQPVPGRVAIPQLATTFRPKHGVWATLSRRPPLAPAGS